MNNPSRYFLIYFRENLHIPVKSCPIRQICAWRCRNLRYSTPFLHPVYTCSTFTYFIISPAGRVPRGNVEESRVSPERECHGHGAGRAGACAAKNKILYIFHTHRSSQRGCGLFLFDIFPALSVLLYRKAHNLTKERTPQKGPALFCCQGKMPQPAVCPLFSEIRK